MSRGRGRGWTNSHHADLNCRTEEEGGEEEEEKGKRGNVVLAEYESREVPSTLRAVHVRGQLIGLALGPALTSLPAGWLLSEDVVKVLEKALAGSQLNSLRSVATTGGRGSGLLSTSIPGFWQSVECRSNDTSPFRGLSANTTDQSQVSPTSPPSFTLHTLPSPPTLHTLPSPPRCLSLDGNAISVQPIAELLSLKSRCVTGQTGRLAG